MNRIVSASSDNSLDQHHQPADLAERPFPDLPCVLIYFLSSQFILDTKTNQLFP
uniref:Uncharacterized protein n=1 Tax=Anguilla anguilla TaxID=7936 RepID=A0A0E9RXM0_ANGAN